MLTSNTKTSAKIKDILGRFVQPHSFGVYGATLVSGLYLYFTPWTHSPTGLVVILGVDAVASVLIVHHDKWLPFHKEKKNN